MEAPKKDTATVEIRLAACLVEVRIGPSSGDSTMVSSSLKIMLLSPTCSFLGTAKERGRRVVSSPRFLGMGVSRKLGDVNTLSL